MNDPCKIDSTCVWNQHSPFFTLSIPILCYFSLPISVHSTMPQTHTNIDVWRLRTHHIQLGCYLANTSFQFTVPESKTKCQEAGIAHKIYIRTVWILFSFFKKSVYFLLFGWAAGIWGIFADQGSNLPPLPWKPGVVTTGLPGKSQGSMNS